MPHIIWKGVTKPDDAIFDLLEPLPKGSTRLKTPESMGKAMVYGLPFMVLCFLALFWKARVTGVFAPELGFRLLGIVLGVLCCVPHELLHALPQPKNADAYIGLVPQGFLFYMKCAAPLSRNRFLFMSLLPMVLGVVPLLLFLLIPAEWGRLNAVLWPMAMIGLVSPCPDYLNVVHVLRETPKNAWLQDGPDGIYWYQGPAHK